MPFRSRSFRALHGAIIVALAGLAGTACDQTDTTTTSTDDSASASAALLLRPSEFMGDTPCSAAPGAMRSYVATLTDHVKVTTTDPETNEETVVEYPFTFPSSLPTPCSKGVRFDDIVGTLEGSVHYYSVQIDGYEAFADELCPEGCMAKGEIVYDALKSGKRTMQYADGTIAVPRWAGSCGEGDQDLIVPNAAGTTLISACDPLVDLEADGPQKTVVVVNPLDTLDPPGTLGGIVCAEGDTAGVASFDILSDDGFAPYNDFPCKIAGDRPYEGDKLVPGEGLGFYVAARAEDGGPVVWGAECSAIVQEGLTVRAACDPLSDEGSVRIDITALLKKFGVECSGDITSYDVSFSQGGVELGKTGVPCTISTSFSPLPPGEAAGSVVVHTKDGSDLFNFACAATVEPGRAATPICILQ